MKTLATTLMVIGLAWAGGASAKSTAAQAAELGKSLTPVGAIAAANQAGTIPAWNGGMAKLGPMFDSFKKGSGDYYPDPFPTDKPLFKITPENGKQYAAMLPAGALRRLELDAKLFYNVYPTRRTATFPDEIYAATKANALTAEFSGDDTLSNAKLGFPFPIPGSGAEVMVNHRVRYRGDSVKQTGNTIVVNRNGAYVVNRYEQSVLFAYGNITKPGDPKENLIFQVIRKDTFPARLAGNETLVWDHLDGSRDAWQYSPGTNRVRQAPTVAFDNPTAGTDGLQNVDQQDMFNGSQKRYTWKLVGKKEMYIPYNNYKLVRPELKLKDLVQPGHINPDNTRYELHRVWIVEANIKPGEGNVYKMRRFYVDEDSWSIAAVDCYDSRNSLWKYQEGFVIPLVADKAVVSAPTVTYDLFSGRYVISNLPNEDGYIAKFGVPFVPGYFTPQNLQKLGRS